MRSLQPKRSSLPMRLPRAYPAAVLGEFHVATGTPQVEQHDTGFIGISGAFGAHATNE